MMMMMMEFEGRRLTGANFHSDKPLALIDTAFDADSFAKIFSNWQLLVNTLYKMLGRTPPETGFRVHDKGQCLFASAPIDALYSTITLIENALNLAIKPDFKIHLVKPTLEDLVDSLKALYQAEARPDILHLQKLASDHSLPFLWDDDQLSIGHGKHSITWDLDALPNPDVIDWASLGKIPLAMITGTNGKSSCTRLTSHILAKAHYTPGFSSTDGIWAGDQCLDTGDYSGPGGARSVLRNNRVDAAVLEIARGGLLRRGLGTENADVALITNVAKDHLGEFGVNTLAELIEAKFIIRKGLHDKGTLILNADDQGSVEFSKTLNIKLTWFSLSKENPIIKAQLKKGASCFFTSDGHLLVSTQGEEEIICAIDDIPITLKGAAKHNIANALAASALCWQLGVSAECIREGLISFGAKQKNPGRGNLFQIGECSIMVDFAHNPHGLNAVVDTLLQLPAKRRLIMLGHAGDRRDEDIDALTRAALGIKPDQIIIFEMIDYLRGRELGEIPAIIKQTLKQCGYDMNKVQQASDPLQGTIQALDWAQSGDFLLLLVLAEREKVFDLLTAKESHA